jgi:hypothetical protein
MQIDAVDEPCIAKLNDLRLTDERLLQPQEHAQHVPSAGVESGPCQAHGLAAVVIGLDLFLKLRRQKSLVRQGHFHLVKCPEQGAAVTGDHLLLPGRGDSCFVIFTISPLSPRHHFYRARAMVGP